MDKGHGLVEVDRTGAIVHELKQRDPENEMHHAIVVTPRDTVLYLTFDTAGLSPASGSRARRSGNGIPTPART